VHLCRQPACLGCEPLQRGLPMNKSALTATNVHAHSTGFGELRAPYSRPGRGPKNKTCHQTLCVNGHNIRRCLCCDQLLWSILSDTDPQCGLPGVGAQVFSCTSHKHKHAFGTLLYPCMIAAILHIVGYQIVVCEPRPQMALIERYVLSGCLLW
jgi:hypothetical protein